MPNQIDLTSHPAIMSDAPPPSYWLDSAKRVTAGGVAGCLAKTAIAPLERMRILAQTGKAAGLVDASRMIVQAEGVRGFWRSNLINCVRTYPSKGALFMCHDRIKGFFKGVAGKKDGESLGPALYFVAGSLSGMIACTIAYPLDLARTRVAGHIGGSGAFETLGGTVRATIAKEGVAGLYRGIQPTLMGAIPYEGVKFCVWDMTERVSRDVLGQEEEGVLVKLGRGALAGCIAGGIMFPNDTVRRLLQMQGTGHGTGVAYTGAISCYKHTFETHGIRRFYRGLTPYLLRMVPNTAIQFYCCTSCDTSCRV